MSAHVSALVQTNFPTFLWMFGLLRGPSGGAIRTLSAPERARHSPLQVARAIKGIVDYLRC